MTSSHDAQTDTQTDAQTPNKPKSMIDADTANGEAPNPDDDESTGQSEKRGVAHPTGTRQAQENVDNDPPA